MRSTSQMQFIAIAPENKGCFAVSSFSQQTRQVCSTGDVTCNQKLLTPKKPMKYTLSPNIFLPHAEGNDPKVLGNSNKKSMQWMPLCHILHCGQGLSMEEQSRSKADHLTFEL